MAPRISHPPGEKGSLSRRETDFPHGTEYADRMETCLQSLVLSMAKPQHPILSNVRGKPAHHPPANPQHTRQPTVAQSLVARREKAKTQPAQRHEADRTPKKARNTFLSIPLKHLTTVGPSHLTALSRRCHWDFGTSRTPCTCVHPVILHAAIAGRKLRNLVA